MTSKRQEMTKRTKRKEGTEMLKQRLAGIVFLAISVISAIVDGGDITASILLVPLGLLCLFGREKYID